MGDFSVRSRVVGTWLEEPLRYARWIADTRSTILRPEKWPLHLEWRYLNRALVATVQPEWNCVDVGAHIGSMTSLFRRLAPVGSHVAIEPTPRKADQLRLRFPDVECHEVAVADIEGDVTFYDYPKSSGYSGLARRANEGAEMVSYLVRGTTLDYLFPQGRRVDLIKIDIEGAELPALRGATRLLADERPFIVFECTIAAVLEGFGYDRSDLFNYLDEAGYSIRSVSDFVFGRSALGRSDFRRAGEYPYPGFNYIATPKNHPVHRIMR